MPAAGRCRPGFGQETQGASGEDAELAMQSLVRRLGQSEAQQTWLEAEDRRGRTFASARFLMIGDRLAQRGLVWIQPFCLLPGLGGVVLFVQLKQRGVIGRRQGHSRIGAACCREACGRIRSVAAVESAETEVPLRAGQSG